MSDKIDIHLTIDRNLKAEAMKQHINISDVLNDAVRKKTAYNSHIKDEIRKLFLELMIISNDPEVNRSNSEYKNNLEGLLDKI